jgi:hypothetical protein
MIRRRTIAIFATALHCGLGVMAQEPSPSTRFFIYGTGMTGEAATNYVFSGAFDDNAGAFSGRFDIGFPATEESDAIRRAAARIWELNLRRSLPSDDHSIAELGGHDLVIESVTTILGAGGYESFAQVSGSGVFFDVAARFQEPNIGNGSVEHTQESVTTFWGDGPSRVRFEAVHRDANGEHSITRGLIHLNGKPEAVLDRPINMQSSVTFLPDRRASEAGASLRGAFSGMVKVTSYRRDLPYNPAEVFSGPGTQIVDDRVDFTYQLVEEISTINLDVKRYPKAADLPFTVTSEDGKLLATFSRTSRGGLLVAGTVQHASLPCPNRMCNSTATACVAGPLMWCFCGRINGPRGPVLHCSHGTCSGGGGGVVQPGASAFSAELPSGSW